MLYLISLIRKKKKRKDFYKGLSILYYFLAGSGDFLESCCHCEVVRLPADYVQIKQMRYNSSKSGFHFYKS